MKRVMFGFLLAIATAAGAIVSNPPVNLPAGTILDYGGATVPAGYVACDGSALSRTTYAALFAAIGTTWGAGDGSTTFNVPNLARRVTVGSGGSGTATLAATVGSTGGEETHAMVTGEMPSHGHTFSGNTGGRSAAHTHTGTTNEPSIQNTGGASSGLAPAGGSWAYGTFNMTTGTESADHSHAFSGTTANAGSGTAFNQLQPSAVVRKICKA